MISSFRSLVIAALLSGSLPARSDAAPPRADSPNNQSEVWIAARTDGRPGSGSEPDPYDGSTASRFDELMAAVPANTAIHLLPGSFHTKGIVPKSGWRLLLSNKTTLTLDVLASVPALKWAIFGAGSPDAVSHVWIEGGVWDCNLQNQKVPLAAQAISFICREGDVTIKNIKVVNWGSTAQGAEGFVVSVFNVGSTGTVAKNIVFDGIEVTQPAAVVHKGTSTLIGAHGQDAVDQRKLSNGWLENVEIRNCYVHDIDLAVTSAAVGMGSWCKGVHIHQNRFENLGPKNHTLFGCYLDTGASEDLVIENNSFSGVVHSVWANLSTPFPVTKWVIRNNRISINRSDLSGGVELSGGNTTMTNVTVERNRIGSSTGGKVRGPGIILEKISGATVRDNVIDDIEGAGHIVLRRGVTECRSLNNHKRDGTPLTAKKRPFL